MPADAPTSPAPGSEPRLAAETRAGRLLVAGPFLVCAVLALLLGAWRKQLELVAVAVPFGLVGFAAWRSRVRPRARVNGFLFVLATVCALVAVPELALRLAGFKYGSRMQFGYPDPEQYLDFEPDAQLFWKLPASRPEVNDLGFIGPEVKVPVPPGVRRILFLGDSCTQQGHPARVCELLRTVTRDSIECVNLAMAGYTSYQGRVLTETLARNLGSEVAVICFGWNDHWLAFGQPDAAKKIDVRLEKAYRASRLLQLVRRVLVAVAPRRDIPAAGPRVTPEQYRDNLRAMIAAYRQSGAAVLLVTSPTSMTYRGVPPYLLEKRFVTDPRTVLPLHAEYNEVVRDVARSEGVWLLDLATELGTPAADRCFHEDRIHFTPRGREEVALRTAAFLREHWLEAGASGARTAAGHPAP